MLGLVPVEVAVKVIDASLRGTAAGAVEGKEAAR